MNIQQERKLFREIAEEEGLKISELRDLVLAVRWDNGEEVPRCPKEWTLSAIEGAKFCSLETQADLVSAWRAANRRDAL